MCVCVCIAAAKTLLQKATVFFRLQLDLLSALTFFDIGLRVAGGTAGQNIKCSFSSTGVVSLKRRALALSVSLSLALSLSLSLSLARSLLPSLLLSASSSLCPLSQSLCLYMDMTLLSILLGPRTRWLHDYRSLSLQEESETTDIPLQTHTRTHPFVSWFITRYKHRKNRRVHTKPPHELSEQTRTSRTHSSFRAAACRGLTKLSSFLGGLEGVEFPV